MTQSPHNLVLVTPTPDQPLDQAVAAALLHGSAAPTDLPALTNVVQGDPYLAEQLAALRASWELHPEPVHGLIARIRTRLAWWLLGPELRQANRVHATMLRLIDSLIVVIDHERLARRALAERMHEPMDQP
jgi:hypothetical protein